MSRRAPLPASAMSATPSEPPAERPAEAVDHHLLSAKLARLARRPDERVTIGELSEEFGDGAFGALMLVLALLGMLPSVPGTSAVVGGAIAVIAVQLVAGAETLWLPRRLADRSFPRSALESLLARTSATLRWLENWSSPRLLSWFTPLGRRLIGVLCVAMSVALALPLPFLNFVPGLAVAFFAFGLLQRDGVAVFLGVLTTAATLVAIVFLGWLTVWVAGLFS